MDVWGKRRLNSADESMSDFLKCECQHCGQPIEYPSEGTGQTVSCPTCEQSITLTPTGAPFKLLPVFSDTSLRSIEVMSSDRTKTYIVNLLDYTCSCQLCLEIHSGVPPRDFGRLCKHIIIALRGKNLVAQLPPIAKGIVENGYPEAFGVYPGRFAEDLYGRPIYITGKKNYDGWINILALLRRNGVNYSRFGYNVNSRRWYFKNLSYLYLPKIDESILYYAVKSSLLLSFLESMPAVSAKLKAPITADRKFEEVVKSAQDAAVLVLVY